MEPRTKLKNWMEEHGYSNSALAKELGFTYEYIYKIVEGKDKKRVTVNFQIKFINHFGWDEAARAIDITLPMPANAEIA